MNKITSFTEKKTLVSMEYLKLTYWVAAAVLYTNSINVSRCNTAAWPNELVWPSCASTGALHVGAVLCSAAAPSAAARPAAAASAAISCCGERRHLGSARGTLEHLEHAENRAEFQWTSEKVNLRRGVSPGATAAALGLMQSRTSESFHHTRQRAKRFPFVLVSSNCPISIHYCALRLLSTGI